MMKRTLTALALSFAPLTAQAGDPCPITIGLVDLGVPSWLDQNALIAAQGDVQRWYGFRSHQLTTGRAISFVHPDSPMERAGIKAGGVITKINGSPVLDEASYVQIIDATAPTDVVQLTIAQDGSVKRYNVTVGVVDPIPIGIAEALNSRDCSAGEITTASAAQKDALHSFFYDSNRRFRCDDAHVDLAGALPPYTTSEAYILRGSRRIIIAMPPWGTTCVNVSEVSGANLTTASLLKVIDRVAADYVADRRANP